MTLIVHNTSDENVFDVYVSIVPKESTPKTGHGTENKIKYNVARFERLRLPHGERHRLSRIAYRPRHAQHPAVNVVLQESHRERAGVGLIWL